MCVCACVCVCVCGSLCECSVVGGGAERVRSSCFNGRLNSRSSHLLSAPNSICRVLKVKTLPQSTITLPSLPPYTFPLLQALAFLCVFLSSLASLFPSSSSSLLVLLLLSLYSLRLFLPSSFLLSFSPSYRLGLSVSFDMSDGFFTPKARTQSDFAGC